MSYQSSLDELSALPDDELEKKALLGMNLHLDSSEASFAKRILENRRQKRQVAAVEKVEMVTIQLEKSHGELVKVAHGMSEIVGILKFIQRHWLPNKPTWLKVVSLIAGTILLGIVINLAADWIAKFWLGW